VAGEVEESYCSIWEVRSYDGEVGGGSGMEDGPVVGKLLVGRSLRDSGAVGRKISWLTAWMLLWC
jgi:hypothetical protein